MEVLQEALLNLLITVLVGVIGIVGTYATIYFNRVATNIKASTSTIEDGNKKQLIENALDRVSNLVLVNVIKAQETLVKEIYEKAEDGVFNKQDLKDIAVVVKNDVINQMGSQVTELVKVEIEDIDGYISALIEKTLAELKGQVVLTA